MFSTVGLFGLKKAFPAWIPDVIAFEEASQVCLDEFESVLIRERVSGRNKNGDPVSACHGVVKQIICLGDTQQLVSDVSSSFNIDGIFFKI